MQSRSQPDQSRSFRGRSLGQKMALFMIPLLVLFMLLVGAATYYQTMNLIQQSALSEMNVVSATLLEKISVWETTKSSWLALADNPELRQSVIVYLNQPDLPNRNDVLKELEAVRTNGSEEVFSNLSILRLEGDTASLLLSTETAWETALPPSLTLLPHENAASLLLFDDPIASPGSAIFLSSLPLSISGDARPDIIIAGTCMDQAMMALFTDLRSTASLILPDGLQTSDIYLSFQPNVLIPVSLSSEASPAADSSFHPGFNLTAGTETIQDSYTTAGGTMLTSASWKQGEEFGIILDSPRSAALSPLIGFAPFLAALIFIGALLSTIVVILGTRQLLRPLDGLVEYAARISQGEWDQHMKSSGTDEFGTLARTFNQMVDRLSALYQSLEAKVEDRTRQIRTASEVARTATSSPSLEDLLQRAVNLIADRFGYNSVSLYLLSPDGTRAILKESSSDAGQLLLTREYSVEVNPESIIGWTITATQLHLAEDIRSDPLHIPEILLPDTLAEAAFPLQFGGRVLGVLDIQSSRQNVFQHEDLEILTTLADELSAAIHNASLAQASATIAARARLITEITGRLSGVLEMDQVLETTADALHSALGKPEVLVKLNPQILEEAGIEDFDAYSPGADTLQTPLAGIDE